MKHLSQILVLFLILGDLFTSCNKAEDTALFAVPNYKTLAEIRASVSIEPSRNTNSEGKIYVTENYLFYIGQETGVHVFDNQNPATPQNIAFINISGVHDIAVRGNYLFADNYFDLLVFDITDINNIVLAQTLENTFNFYPQYPEDAEYFDYETTANEGDFLVGYHLEYKERPEENWNEMEVYDDIATNSGGVGTGGSYAKFQIRNDALYTLENWKLNIFNIAEPTQTFFDHETDFNAWFSGNFETLFIQKQYMFIGSTTGMHIIDILDEFNPQYVSGFSHATACDPVVVHQNTAYITVRGSTTCGAIEDQINVIDITNIEQPTLTSTYLLDEPYGLGYHNNALYVCSSTEGLSIFDTTDLTNLTLQQNYNIDVKDVIPLETHLIAVGNQKIIQFSYEDNYQLEVISEVNF